MKGKKNAQDSPARKAQLGRIPSSQFIKISTAPDSSISLKEGPESPQKLNSQSSLGSLPFVAPANARNPNHDQGMALEISHFLDTSLDHVDKLLMKAMQLNLQKELIKLP